MSKKKNESKWLQVGNFLLGVERCSAGNRLVCKAVSGQWSVTWREDSMMYALMLNLIKVGTEDENVREYVHSLITVWFVITTYTHDLIALANKGAMPFCEGVVRLIKEQNDYEESLKAQPSAEDDEKALQEVGEMQEIEDELDKLDKEQTN